MQVPMTKIRVVGHRRILDETLAALHESGCVHLVDVSHDTGVRLPPLTIDEVRLREIEDLRYLRARLDALLSLLPGELTAGVPQAEVNLEELKADLESAGPEIEALVARADELRQEKETLPRYIDSLQRLLPLLPDMGTLGAYETTALLIDARHHDLLGELNANLTEDLAGNFEIISDRLDSQTIGAIVIYPSEAATLVEREFHRGQVSRVRLPGRYESVPFRQAIVEMKRRLGQIDAEIENTQDRIEDFVRAHPTWSAARAAIAARLEQLAAIRIMGATPHTFALSGWIAEGDIEPLRQSLEASVGGGVIVEEAAIGRGERPPVKLRNPAPARPFESLVRLLDTPRYGSLDPTLLMMIFLPLFFGMMLGDVVYGAVLLALALLAVRRLRKPGFAHDLTRILVLCGIWAIVWGVVYGEFLGDLGQRWFGMEPLWINREEAIEPLLIFALAVGAAHVTLGMILGVWDAVRSGDRRQLGERVGLLIAIAGLFAIVAIAVDMLPDQALTPAVAGTVVGVVVLIAAGGVLGLLTGPLEVIGTVGNILSYLRIAAIGLASVYLARIANELGITAPLWLGIIVAALLHALNLVLGVFSPTIQALRLHYVEFFGKFYEGGGEPFEPFGQHTTPSNHQ